MRHLPQAQRQLLRALMGAPINILLLIAFAGEPVGADDLKAESLLSKNGITDALQRLKDAGVIQQFRRYEGWVLTRDAQVQLPILFTLLEGLGTEDSSHTKCDSLSVVVVNTDSTVNERALTTTTTGSHTKWDSHTPETLALLPDAAYDIFDTLVDELSVDPDAADEAVRADLARYEVSVVCEDFDLWRAWYAVPDHCKGLGQPVGVVIAAKLRKGAHGPRPATDEHVSADAAARKNRYLPKGFEYLADADAAPEAQP